MINILLIDNEPSLLHLCKTYLERSCDLKVDIALSVKDADERLGEKGYDAIVCEHQLPWRTGLEFLRRLRLKNDPIPFILFTDYGSEEVVIEALNAGADYYLRKGGDPKSKFAELEHMVRDAVHARWLDEAQRLRHAAFEASSVVYVISDATFRITETNSAFLRVWNLEKKSDVLGTPFQRYLLSSDVVDVMMTSVGFLGKWEGELTGKREDGTVFPAYGQVSPLHDTVGEVEGYFLTLIDNPKARTQDEPVQVSEIRYRLLAETASDWLSLQDATGIFIYSNSASLSVSGYEGSELIGHDLIEFIHPEDERTYSSWLQDLRDGSGPLSFESRIRHKDGHYISTVILARIVKEKEDGPEILLCRIKGAEPPVIAFTSTAEPNLVGELPADSIIPEANGTASRTEPIPVMVPILVGIPLDDHVHVVGPDSAPVGNIVTRKDDLVRLEELQGMLATEITAASDPETRGRFETMDGIVASIIAHAKYAEEYDAIGAEPQWQSIQDTFQHVVASSDLDRVYVLNLTNRLEVQADPLLEKAFHNLIEFTHKNDASAHKIWITYEVERAGARIIYEDNGLGISPEIKRSLFHEGEDKYHGLCLARDILKETGMIIEETGDPNKGLRFEILVPLDRYRNTGDGPIGEGRTSQGGLRPSETQKASLAASN